MKSVPLVRAAILTAAALSTRAAGQCSTSEAQLTAPGTTFFGAAVALHGGTALVGAPLSSPQGAESGTAHLYERAAGWSAVKTLSAQNGSAGARFGSAVATSGDLAVVGTPGSGPTGGAVYVFERDIGGAGNWGQMVELTGSSPPDPGQFGAAVSLWNETLAVGAPYTDSTRGRAYILRRVGATSNWTQVKVLAASDGAVGHYFGGSISISGGVAVVGARSAPGAGGLATGAAYVFERNAGGLDNWGEVAKLAAADGEADDRFGAAVAVGGSTIVVGANQDSDLAYNAGSAYVFERDALGHWNEVRKLRASDAGFTDQFGVSAAIEGDQALVGARGAGSYGQAYSFERDLGGTANWGQSSILSPASHPPGGGYFFGCSVALASGTSLVGAHASPSVPNLGAAYVLEPPPSSTAYCTAGTSSSGCSGAIAGHGCPSASSNWHFGITVHGVDGKHLGMLFYGTHGRAALPWGATSSVLCVQPPLQRCFLRVASGTPNACDGVLSLIWNDFAAWNPGALGQPFANGLTLQVQALWRDPASPRHSVLSNALEFTLGP